MEDIFQVGIITSPHGVKGEVKVFPTTDDNNRFKKLKECFIEYKGELMPVKATGCKFFKNMVILKLEGFDSMNDVEKLRQCKIFVDREHAVSLEEDEYFVADLLGITVVDEEGNVLGTLSEVLPTGANDVYVVKRQGEETPGKSKDMDDQPLADTARSGMEKESAKEEEKGVQKNELLIPAIKECILKVDIRERIMTVHLLQEVEV